MFQNKPSQLQSWLQLCNQLDALTKQVSFEKQKLKDAEDFRDQLYNKLPWFYLCRATAGQIQRYNESIADAANAKKVHATVEERERKLISKKETIHNSMLNQDPNYRAAKNEAEARGLLSSKGKYALCAVQDAFNQIKITISEKEKDIIYDIREQRAGEANSGFRNWSVSYEFDCAKSKIKESKRAITDFCESLEIQLPAEAIKLKSVLLLVDESIGNASCGDWWINLDDDPLYGMRLIQKMTTVQGQLQMLIPLLVSIGSNCNNMHDQSMSTLCQIKNSFETKLISYRLEHAVGREDAIQEMTH